MNPDLWETARDKYTSQVKCKAGTQHPNQRAHLFYPGAAAFRLLAADSNPRTETSQCEQWQTEALTVRFSPAAGRGAGAPAAMPGLSPQGRFP